MPLKSPFATALSLSISRLSVVDHILDILSQPFGGIPGSQSHFPQITDLSQVTSEAVQGGGDDVQVETAAVNLAPTVTFVNGKHEVPHTCLFCQYIIPLHSKYCFILISHHL